MSVLKLYQSLVAPSYKLPDGMAEFKTGAAFGLGLPRVARAKYDFSVDGGVSGLITPGAAYNSIIPANAIVIGGFLNVTTALTSGGSATISLGTSAGSSATAIKAATAVATYALNAILAVVPVFTAASAFKMSAAGSITLTVAVADLTAGVMEMNLLYVTQSA